MQAVFDIRILELLCARLCHDLISPVSAIGNGVELITEFGDGMQGEALSLIGDSAAAASHLLQFYRAVLGSARGSDGASLPLAEARARTLDALGGGRIVIDWPEGDGADLGPLSGRAVKLLLGLVLSASDFLPGTGEIQVRMKRDGAAILAEVAAVKDGLVLSTEFHGALVGTAASEDLTPRTVTGRYCHLLASSLGSALGVETQTGRVVLRVRLSPAT